MSSVDIEVTLNVKTCSCGAIYAVPHWMERYRCPLCADRNYRSLLERFDEVNKTKTHLEHVVVGLRGALKRRAA